MPETGLEIPFRFRGPPRSGNGGYVAGAIARLVDPAGAGAVEVTLRAPIPLDTAMQVEPGEPLRVAHGEVLVAEARPSSSTFPIRRPVTRPGPRASARPRSPRTSIP